jgi:hypothetical protein
MRVELRAQLIAIQRYNRHASASGREGKNSTRPMPRSFPALPELKRPTSNSFSASIMAAHIALTQTILGLFQSSKAVYFLFSTAFSAPF